MTNPRLSLRDHPQALKRVLELYWNSRNCFPNNVVRWTFGGAYEWQPDKDYYGIGYNRGRRYPSHYTKPPYHPLPKRDKLPKVVNWMPVREREGQISYLH